MHKLGFHKDSLPQLLCIFCERQNIKQCLFLFILDIDGLLDFLLCFVVSHTTSIKIFFQNKMQQHYHFQSQCHAHYFTCDVVKRRPCGNKSLQVSGSCEFFPLTHSEHISYHIKTWITATFYDVPDIRLVRRAPVFGAESNLRINVWGLVTYWSNHMLWFYRFYIDWTKSKINH